MLTTAIQYSIKIDTTEHLGIKEYTYTCYGDSENKNIFYVVPEIPIFSGQENKPDFLFYKYRKEEQQGGYAQFTVKLPVPTQSEGEKIKTQLYKGISPQLAAKSRLIVKYVQAENKFTADPTNKANQEAREKAFKNTGLTEEQAKEYVVAYNPKEDEEQFLGRLMPDEHKIELRQPRYTSAQASLIINENKVFYSQTPTPLSPSGLGNNDTVFSLSLTGLGATLFENVLKGTPSNASVGIRYNFTLDASLPAVKVIVTYDSEKMKTVAQTITRHTWSADEKEITREFSEKGAAKVSVIPGLSPQEMGMKDEQYNAWIKTFEDWGQAQLQQILSSQTGLDMSLDLLNDAGSFDKFKESLKNTQSFTRIYEENRIVPFSIAPQAQLPSILSIVGAGKVDDYFKEYDLDDPFFKFIQPEFYVSQDLAKYNIENIIVIAKYDDNHVSTLRFDSKNSEPQKTEKWYVDKKLGRTYSYSYTVNFSGLHSKPYHSGKIDVTDSLVQYINMAQCGIVYAQIDSLLDEQAWKTFSQVLLKAQYSDPAHGIELKSDVQLLNVSTPPKPFIYPVGMKPENPIYFTTDYHTRDGGKFTYIEPGIEPSPQLPGYGSTRANQIQIMNALPRQTSYSIFFIASKKDVLIITFDMTVNYKTYKFKQTQSINLEEKDLEENTTRRNLIFGFLPDGTDDIPEITYSGTVIYNDERDPKPIEGKVTGSSVAVKC
ncbi:hypothetical protein EXT66_06135 [Pectobacterium carotovorum subsp. carotovorum]|uniref:hypothetical protein n=1 Tax=Pectobacterium versatile TaxID=2488639 RepID=UPI00202D2360|nr:hypothetical protein [Pectobacterium carotovorum]MCL6333401.1 hypothetical protein [Pectobacterium carotovorum subsp. carotovorum]MCL6345379.1 hypothetical protein [Pectobacterium carotovorum subsp. carotovorum]MCL6400860.1 hypothetical protein [Pectobacterium carotovorum subsp. carotovorum]